MKKLFILVAILVVTGQAWACDYCNCYLGLDPGYNKNTIGIRANYMKSAVTIPASSGLKLTHSSHGGGTSNGNSSELEQAFFCTELFVRVYPVPRLQLIANLPYQYNTLTFDGKEESRGALNDLTLLAMYQLANTTAMDSNKVRHRVFGGLGVKLPTGKSSGASDVDIPYAHDLYSGTGSTDYLVAASYIGKYRKLGWNLDVNYKLNTESKNEYKFGNSLNLVPRAFYEVHVKSLRILPHLGAAYERGGHDEYMDEQVDETGGATLWGSAGVDVYFNRFSITTEARIPFYHDTPDSLPEASYWLFTSFNIHF